ncbi:MAG: POTRA domain-containing protein, partial [Terriglobales bacterium]
MAASGKNSGFHCYTGHKLCAVDLRTTLEHSGIQLNLRYWRAEFWLTLFLAAALACAQTPAAPQTAHTASGVVENLPAYEGQTVTSVELAGWPGLDPAPLVAQLPQQPRTPFSRAEVDQSIGQLKARLANVAAPDGSHVTGIQLQIIPEPGGIRILYVLEPAEYFGVFQFPGALRYTYTRLLEASGYEPQQPYSARNVTEGMDRLQAFFQREGYFQARVTPALHPFPQRGLVDVVFEVHMGPRARFGTVTLAGATPQQAAFLQPSLRTWLARLRRSAILPGHAYALGTLENATQRLQSALNDRGHLGAQVVLAGAKYDPAANRADITFNVVPGPTVKLNVKGMHLWPWDHSLIPIYQESRVDAELIQEGQENLVNFLSSRGYFNASVTTTVQRPNEAPTVTTQSAASLAPPILPPPST